MERFEKDYPITKDIFSARNTDAEINQLQAVPESSGLMYAGIGVTLIAIGLKKRKS